MLETRWGQLPPKLRQLTEVRRFTPRMHKPCVTTLTARARSALGTASSAQLNPSLGLIEGKGKASSLTGAVEAYALNVVQRLGAKGRKKGKLRKCCCQFEG